MKTSFRLRLSLIKKIFTLITLYGAASLTPFLGYANKEYTAADDGGFFVDNFTYAGKPIHPYCIGILLHNAPGYAIGSTPEEGQQVNLKTCSLNHLPVATNPDEQKGYYTTQAQFTGKKQPIITIGYQAVSTDPKYPDVFALWTTMARGDANFFTTVFLVKKSDKTLTVIKSIAAGNKCDGGLTATENPMGIGFNYEEKLTPQRLIALGRGTEAAAAQLPNNPSTCIGSASWTFHYATQDSTLEGVTIADANSYQKNIESSHASPAEKCLANLLVKATRKTTYFTEHATEEFADKFVRECINANSSE